VIRFVKYALVASCILGLSGTASAVKWLSDASYRVSTMGGAKLAFDDETSTLSVFNHENLAGLALNTKENRVDAGLYYDSGDMNVTVDSLFGTIENKTTRSDMELTRPGGEYRGLTYWLDDATVVRVGVEGLLMNSKSTTSMTGFPDTEESFDFSGLGGGLSFAYKTDMGLIIGAGASYTGAGGKPGSLEGDFDLITPIAQMAAGPAYISSETTKVDMTANNLNWAVGLAYVLDQLGDGNSLSLGMQVSADDDRPNMAGVLDPSSISAMTFGDYTTVIDAAGTVTAYDMTFSPVTADVTGKQTYTVTPMKISGEAIFNMGSLLEAGLLFDSKTKDVKFKSELTTPLGTDTADYKVLSQNIMGISPIVRAHLPIAEGLTLLPGVMFTTYGSGTVDEYAPDSATSSYKAASTKSTASQYALALGLQALNKQLQFGVQYSGGSSKDESTFYDPTGAELGTATSPEVTLGTLGLGAEYQVIPAVAVRAGYLTSTNTTKGTGGAEDQKDALSRITVGAGVTFPNNSVTDLMVRMDTYQTEPATPGIDFTQTGFGVFIGHKTVF